MTQSRIHHSIFSFTSIFTEHASSSLIHASHHRQNTGIFSSSPSFIPSRTTFISSHPNSFYTKPLYPYNISFPKNNLRIRLPLHFSSGLASSCRCQAFDQVFDQEFDDNEELKPVLIDGVLHSPVTWDFYEQFMGYKESRKKDPVRDADDQAAYEDIQRQLDEMTTMINKNPNHIHGLRNYQQNHAEIENKIENSIPGAKSKSKPKNTFKVDMDSSASPNSKFFDDQWIPVKQQDQKKESKNTSSNTKKIDPAKIDDSHIITNEQMMSRDALDRWGIDPDTGIAPTHLRDSKSTWNPLADPYSKRFANGPLNHEFIDQNEPVFVDPNRFHHPEDIDPQYVLDQMARAESYQNPDDIPSTITPNNYIDQILGGLGDGEDAKQAKKIAREEIIRWRHEQDVRGGEVAQNRSTALAPGNPLNTTIDPLEPDAPTSGRDVHQRDAEKNPPIPPQFLILAAKHTGLWRGIAAAYYIPSMRPKSLHSSDPLHSFQPIPDDCPDSTHTMWYAIFNPLNQKIDNSENLSRRWKESRAWCESTPGSQLDENYGLTFHFQKSAWTKDGKSLVTGPASHLQADSDPISSSAPKQFTYDLQLNETPENQGDCTILPFGTTVFQDGSFITGSPKLQLPHLKPRGMPDDFLKPSPSAQQGHNAKTTTFNVDPQKYEKPWVGYSMKPPSRKRPSSSEWKNIPFNTSDDLFHIDFLFMIEGNTRLCVTLIADKWKADAYSFRQVYVNYETRFLSDEIFQEKSEDFTDRVLELRDIVGKWIGKAFTIQPVYLPQPTSYEQSRYEIQLGTANIDDLTWFGDDISKIDGDTDTLKKKEIKKVAEKKVRYSRSVREARKQDQKAADECDFVETFEIGNYKAVSTGKFVSPCRLEKDELVVEEQIFDEVTDDVERGLQMVDFLRLENEVPVRKMIFLNGGLYCSYPEELVSGVRFEVEVGYLVPNKRVGEAPKRIRMIRSYNVSGEFVSGTIIHETKVL